MNQASRLGLDLLIHFLVFELMLVQQMEGTRLQRYKVAEAQLGKLAHLADGLEQALEGRLIDPADLKGANERPMRHFRDSGEHFIVDSVVAQVEFSHPQQWQDDEQLLGGHVEHVSKRIEAIILP